MIFTFRPDNLGLTHRCYLLFLLRLYSPPICVFGSSAITQKTVESAGFIWLLIDSLATLEFSWTRQLKKKERRGRILLIFRCLPVCLVSFVACFCQIAWKLPKKTDRLGQTKSDNWLPLAFVCLFPIVILSDSAFLSPKPTHTPLYNRTKTQPIPKCRLFFTSVCGRLISRAHLLSFSPYLPTLLAH